MPTDERGWLNDDQSVRVIEEVCPQGEQQSGGVIEPSWRNPMFLVEGKLFAKKQVLRDQRTSGLDQGSQNPNDVSGQGQQQNNERAERDGPVHWGSDRMTRPAQP